MIHESERVLLGESEVLFKVNGEAWHLGVSVEYTERRCHLIAVTHLYNPTAHSVTPTVRSWGCDLFWCLRGHEPERLGQLIEHVVRTTVQESNRQQAGKEEGWHE